MFGNKKLKLKKKRMNTANILHNKNAQMIAKPNMDLNKNRPHSKNIFENRKKSKDKIPIKININNKKIKIRNLNPNINNKNMNINNYMNVINININAQKNFNHIQKEKKFRFADLSHGAPINKKKYFLGKGNDGKKEIKNNLINNNNNNMFIDNLSKSFKKNNLIQNNQIKFYDLIEANSKENKEKKLIQNIIKKNTKKEKEKILPIIRNSSKDNIIFSEEDNVRPDNEAVPVQLNLINNEKDLEINKKINLIPINNGNKKQVFNKNNFNNNKKYFLGLPDKKVINNNLINMNINININNNKNDNVRYEMNNNLKENSKKFFLKKKNNLIFYRKNNFKFNENIINKNHDRFKIKKSIDNIFNKNKIKNNLIENNNLIGKKPYSSSEEPIIISQNKLKQNQKDIINQNKISDIKSVNQNNDENYIKIKDYFFKEEKNSRFRDEMEDFVLIKHPYLNLKNNHLSLFAVFDGHGGSAVSEYLKNNFCENLKKTINKEYTLTFRKILRKSIENIDKDFEGMENAKNCGSTGTFVIINNNSIYCANVGDSKCFYINEKEAIQLSEDHNCKNKEEVNELRNRGVIVFQNRVFGTLALTRSFGDVEFKSEGITATPFINKIFVDKNNVKYIVIASDGIWDIVDNKQLFQIYTELKEKTSKEFCNNLVNYAMENGSTDNISCVIIKFDH